jgi:6-phosphogluconolactonase
MDIGLNEARTFDIVISGYGSREEATIARYHVTNHGEYHQSWKASIENASYVCKSEDYLFTVTELDDHAVVYLFRQESDEYLLLDQRQVEGGALCHITYSAKNRMLYGACYGTGTVFALRTQEDCFGDLVFCEIQPVDQGKELTRAHCVLLGSNEDELLTINIALDQIICYQLAQGIPVLSRAISMPEGVGPRHAIYSVDEVYLYIITEYSNEVFVYKNETRELIQRISTLPEEYLGSSNCSTLCLSKDGKYLYAANRGADTVTLFRVDSEGKLTWVQDFLCGGKHPRHMILTKQEDLLIICNQHSNQVVAYHIDEISGKLGEKVFEIVFPSPSGLLEI